jgi:hypothetical protein
VKRFGSKNETRNRKRILEGNEKKRFGMFSNDKKVVPSRISAISTHKNRPYFAIAYIPFFRIALHW